MKKLIAPLIALTLAFGSCKSKTNASYTDSSHTPGADTARIQKDSLKDTSRRVKITSPGEAATTPGATGIGTPGKPNKQ